MSGRTAAIATVTAVVTLVVAGWWLGRSDDPIDRGCGSEPDGPSALIGFDVHSGDVRWQRTVGIVHGAAHVDDVVITRAASDVLRAHEIGSGALRWCRSIEPAEPTFESFAGLARLENGVALASGGDIVSYDADGRERWRTPAPYDSVWLYGDDVVWVFEGGTARPRDPYTALDHATGEPLSSPPALPPWHGLMAYGFNSSPTRAGQFEITWVSDDATDANDIDLSVMQSGVEAWRRELPGELAAIAASDVGPVVVVSDDRSTLTGYSASDGREIWTIPLRTTPFLIAPLDASHLVVPQGHELSVIDPATGSTRWTADLGSPGRGGSYSLPGSYSLITSDSADVAVGLINAHQPARD